MDETERPSMENTNSNIIEGVQYDQPVINDLTPVETEKVKEEKKKKRMEICFKKKNDEWKEGCIINRTGKATGKYTKYWNIETIKI